MADLQVTCITKNPPYSNLHEAISHLGGNGWYSTRAQVIQQIEAGVNSFFTMVNGKRANVGVVDGPTGKYLRTYADGYYNDNLLALAACR